MHRNNRFIAFRIIPRFITILDTNLVDANATRKQHRLDVLVPLIRIDGSIIFPPHLQTGIVETSEFLGEELSEETQDRIDAEGIESRLSSED